ncbi:MAG: suppressor of fused domain protein [Chloroflexi bacterium]|nr:suppressor of fused domain protein [Chloroflexota bacterium]
MFENWKKRKADKEEKLEDDAYQIKDKYIESIMGKEHDMVGHAIIPYCVGGAFDQYYYPDFCNGTAIVTKELVNYKFNSPKNDIYDAYELVIVTRNKINTSGELALEYDDGPFIEILNMLGRYSTTAKLNPFETIEFPDGFENENLSRRCLIIDAISEPLCNEETHNRKFGLMLIMEIHRDEMEFAMQQKGKDLIEKLKQKGIYPLTGVNRPSVFS